MHVIQAKFVRFVPTDDGVQADLQLLESNGDALDVRFLLRYDGRCEIGVEGDGAELGYLNERYGPVQVLERCKKALLAEC